MLRRILIDHRAILIMLTLLLLLISITNGRKRSRKSHRSAPCMHGCLSCDGANGCLKCRSRMFLFINAEENRESGVCKHSCPAGYFGQRGRMMNKCAKCEVEHCKSCFTSTYCTACQQKYFLHAAECVEKCPGGLSGNIKTGKCEEKVECVVSAWSSWSKCARRSSTRSCKHGRKKRTREIVQESTENGDPCPKLKETKKCKTAAKDCICEWDRELFNKWLHQMRKKRRERRKKGEKNKPKKRKRKSKVQSNSTLRLLENDKLNMTSTMPQFAR